MKKRNKTYRNWNAIEERYLDEKDVVFEYSGYKCIIRVNQLNYRCGYVLLPTGHPMEKCHYDAIDSRGQIHGGLTYSGHFTPFWSAGFDCAHAGDAPIRQVFDLSDPFISEWPDIFGITGHAWTEDEVREETKKLVDVIEDTCTTASLLSPFAFMLAAPRDTGRTPRETVDVKLALSAIMQDEQLAGEMLDSLESKQVSFVPANISFAKTAPWFPDGLLSSEHATKLHSMATAWKHAGFVGDGIVSFDMFSDPTSRDLDRADDISKVVKHFADEYFVKSCYKALIAGVPEEDVYA